ncbi:MAG: M48 family metallopeptidase [Burkholderiaceae bacterium]|jgi:predicted metal-dependent hydrolase|nr:M48 family metallopeptidase [Burkholderiaceae bacterium]
MSRWTAPWTLLQRSLFDEPEPDLPAASPAAVAALPAAPREALAGEVFKHPRAQRDVRLDGHLVAYEMRRARRRSIGFVVGPEGLTVSVPRWVGLKEVDSALQEKRRWILHKLREQRERAARLHSARIDWCDGTELPFLGDTVIVLLDPRATGAVLDNGADGLPGVARRLLRIGLPHTATAEQIRDAVQSWLQRQARRIFEERCAVFALRLNVRVRRIALSSAATRWGSANADGSIRLNWRLVHFGLPVIDYVVAHELAHLREMNHSPAFWDVVRSVLPDYEHSRVALRDGQVPVFD